MLNINNNPFFIFFRFMVSFFTCLYFFYYSCIHYTYILTHLSVRQQHRLKAVFASNKSIVIRI